MSEDINKNEANVDSESKKAVKKTAEKKADSKTKISDISPEITKSATEKENINSIDSESNKAVKKKTVAKKKATSGKDDPSVENTEKSPASTESGTKDQEQPKKEAPTAKDLLSDEIGALKIRKAKGSKNITSGIVHIVATFNNTKVTITDRQGNVISWSSAGKCNFRGSRKSTAYAAQVVTQDATRRAMSHGIKEVVIRIKGPGMGRDSAVRALQSLGLMISSIEDITPVPHNGCRPPKRRRV